MSCGEGVERGAATCVCKGQTVFEGAVIGQVFTGQVRISAPQLLQQRRPRNHEKQRKSLWRRPAFSKGNAMERGTEFTRTRFSVDTVRAAIQAVREVIGETKAEVVHESLKVDLPDGQWRFDDENEFYAAIPQGTGYGFIVDARSVRIQVTQFRRSAVVDVRAPTRAQVQRIFSPFDNRQGAEAVPADSPVVFVGHGRSPAWKDLRDHLRDQHDYRVECYESGARAGHSIRDILESMAAKSSFAVLVMTGEDMQESGTLRARQNVIHEAGLFQGRLGFSRAIILLEEGVEQFSNVQGVQYIPFAKDRIREAYGDVLATLRREFGGG